MRAAAAVLLSAFSLAGQALTIVEPAVSGSPGGAGSPAARQFSAGDRVFLSFAVAGFRTIADTGNMFLEFTIEPVDSRGVPFDRPLSGRLITSTRKPESRPVRFDFVVPPMPMPGEGRFRIAVEDRIGEQTARAEAPFHVASALPPPSGAFEIGLFRYSSSEYSDEAIANPKFKPGDTVWGRFYLSGFAMEANNRYRMSYGVALRNKAGRVIFSERQAASESRESFYPRTHVPGLISVRLEPSIRPGEYALEITAVDEIGGRNTSATFPLRVY